MVQGSLVGFKQGGGVKMPPPQKKQPRFFPVFERALEHCKSCLVQFKSGFFTLTMDFPPALSHKTVQVPRFKCVTYTGGGANIFLYCNNISRISTSLNWLLLRGGDNWLSWGKTLISETLF